MVVVLLYEELTHSYLLDAITYIYIVFFGVMATI
jgi:hypothetical protein